MRFSILFLGIATLVAGCGPSRDAVSITTPVSTVATARVDQDTRARYTYADSVDVGTVSAPQWVSAGVRGDGRLRSGTAAGSGLSNEYQGDFCGVNAVIGSGTGGQTSDLNSDPNMRWSSSLPVSCQPARAYLYFLNGPSAAPNVSRPHQIIRNIATMSVGETRIQPLASGTLSDIGIGLQFDNAYPPASNISVTRLQNVVDEFGRTVRQWRVASQGTHRAMGLVSGKRGLVSSGITYYLPFAMTVTEVPYPFPTYP